MKERVFSWTELKELKIRYGTQFNLFWRIRSDNIYEIFGERFGFHFVCYLDKMDEQYALDVDDFEGNYKNNF